MVPKGEETGYSLRVREAAPALADGSLLYPSKIPLSLDRIGPKRFSDPKKGQLKPTFRELEELCKYWDVPYVKKATYETIVKRILFAKRSNAGKKRADVELSDVSEHESDVHLKPKVTKELHFTLYTLHFTLHTSHFTLYTLHFTPYSLHFMLHASCFMLQPKVTKEISGSGAAKSGAPSATKPKKLKVKPDAAAAAGAVNAGAVKEEKHDGKKKKKERMAAEGDDDSSNDDDSASDDSFLDDSSDNDSDSSDSLWSGELSAEKKKRKKVEKAADYSLLTAHYSLLTAHCSLLTAHGSLLTAYCLLPTAYCSLLTALLSTFRHASLVLGARGGL